MKFEKFVPESESRRTSGDIDFIVDVEVKIGQDLHVLYDTVDRAWQCAFIVMAAVELLKLLLQWR